jgi:Ni,Fe-hydrogenase maturation factor
VDAPRDVQLRALAPSESSQIMAHAADPRTLLALARDVFGHAPEACWLTIPVENIGIGEELSPFACHGLEAALEKIRRLAAEDCASRQLGSHRPSDGLDRQ